MAKIQPSSLQPLSQVVTTIKSRIANCGSIPIPGIVNNRKSAYDLISYFFSYIYCGGIYHNIKGCYISDIAMKLGLSNGNLKNNSARTISCPSSIEQHLMSIMDALHQLGYITKSHNNMILTPQGRNIM